MDNKALKLIGIVGKNILKSILGHPFDIGFKPGDELGYSYVDGKKGKIVINDGTHEMFDDLSLNEKLLALLGIIIHEALHLILTSFSAFKNTINMLSSEMIRLFKTIFNIFEDTRIEYFASVYFGGKALNSLYFMKKLSYDKAPNIDDAEDALSQIINASIQYGDFASIKGNFTTDEAREDFLKITEWHDEAMRCRSCKQCLEIALKATNYLWNKYLDADFKTFKKFADGIMGGFGDKVESAPKDTGEKDEKREAIKRSLSESDGKSEKSEKSGESDFAGSAGEESGSEKEGSDGADGSGDGKPSDKKGDKKSGGKSGTSSDKTKGDSSSASLGETSGISSGGDSSGSGRSSSADSKGTPSGETHRSDSSGEMESTDGIISEEEIEEAIDDLKEDLAKAEKEVKEAEESSIENAVEVEDVTGDAYAKRVIRKYMPGDEAAYEALMEKNAVAEAADTLVHDIKNIFKSRPDGWKMSERGNINAKRWKDPNFVDPRVFDRRIDRKQEVAILIAVDESGSMSRRVHQAKLSAMMLSEALTALHIPYAIVGYSADEEWNFDVNLRYYVNWDSTAFDKTSLVFLDARVQNRDGPTIRLLSEELAKRKERNKLLLVLSDGAPEACAGYTGSKAIADTEAAIIDARRKMSVIGVSMQTSAAPILASMYGNDFIEVKSMDELSETLGDLMKDVARKW